jgi:hypothetical protein
MFHVRGSSDVEGNIAIALEAAIQRAHDHFVPVIYLERARGELGGGDVSGLGSKYASFYMMKHRRPDLIPRTIEGEDYGAFEPDRIRRLPADSIVIANRSAQNDRFVAQMVAAGELKNGALLKAPDGTPVFWILERGAD